MLDQLNDSTTTDKVVTFSEVKKGKEVFYKISNVDKMRPFFMTIVSTPITGCLFPAMEA